MSRSCTWHDEFVAISRPSRAFKRKLKNRNGAKQSGKRYKKGIKKHKNRTDINIVINPIQKLYRQRRSYLTYHISDMFSISNKLQRCQIVHDLRGVGMTFPNLLFDVKE